MRSFRRLAVALLALILLLSFAACRDDTFGDPDPSSSQQAKIPTDESGFDKNIPSDTTGEAEPMEKPTLIPASPQGDKNETQKVIKGAAGGSLPSGLVALEEVHYTVEDPNNTRSLSEKKQSHSHGPAANGQAHPTVVEFQNNFDRFGALTLDRKTPEDERAIYLTFDCGYEYENLTSQILDTLAEKEVPAAFFCTLDHIEKQPDLIARMIREGHIVGNHSNTHPSFPSISRTQMKDEIETTENHLRTNFGYCAKYFRFPAGEYSESALDLVQSLGYTSVFWSVAYSDWDVENQQGKDLAVKTVMERLHPGAVILLHAVSRDNAEALGEIIDLARADGYSFRALTDYPG